MGRANPYRTAVRKLDDLARQAAADGVRRLPTAAELARRFSVSTNTVLKAVDLFVSRGVLVARRGAGIHLAVDQVPPLADIPPHTPSPGERTRWQRLANRLRGDIADARYTPGDPLPSHKELAARYGVCHRTLRRALGELFADGTLEEFGRSCRVPALGTAAQRGKRVVLITRGDSFGDPQMLSARSREHLRLLEAECVRAGVRLQLSTCHYIGLDLVGHDKIAAMLSSPSTVDNILGFIVWTMGINRHFFVDLLVLLASSRKPIAVLDEGAAIRLPQVPGRERIRLFQMALCGDDGRVVGEYLLKLGHRRVAFVTYDPASPFAAARITGLRQAFADAGHPGGVSVWDAGRFPAPKRAYDTVENFLQLLERILPGFHGMPQEAFSVRERVPVWFANQLARAPQLHHRREQLFAMLDAFAAHQGHTAWVGENDTACLACLDYLRLNGLAAPEHVSVVGFDDSFEAFLSRLTSYNFNGAAYMRAMLSHVLNPLETRSRKHADRTMFPGYIVERWTSAPRG